jgi:hydroxypyruvate reductase
VHTLLISDVPNDDPQIIASGPTLPDPTSCADALEIIERYQIALPQAALQGLRTGMFESPKPGDPRFNGHTTRMCATPQLALEAAALEARKLGIQAHILSDAIEGESRVVGQVHAAIARSIARLGEPFSPPCVLLSGGETTVTVRNSQGRGGRAVEFVLGCALALDGERGISVLAADTDGIDGVAGHAGGFADPTTLQRAKALGLSARSMLQANDAFPFFEALGDAIITGPTYTNVNDFRALLIQPPG